jgi:hypothetical protein
MMTSTVDLARQVRELADREELRELQVRYSLSIDDRRIDDLVECFAPDGELGHNDAAVSGREAIAAFYSERLRAYGPTFHYFHGSIYEIDGDVASGILLAHSELAIDGEMFQVALRYVDDYRRDERWTISHRRIRTLYFAPIADLPGIFQDANRLRWPGPPRPADFPEGDPAWEEFSQRR